MPSSILNTRIPALRNQALIGVALFVAGIAAAWEAAGFVSEGDLRSLEFIALAFVVCAGVVATLRNWRTGFLLFFLMMLFEDLPRKYLGNVTALFFGKDVLLAIVYIAFFIQVRQRREKMFHPPFLLFLLFFIWLGALQIFSPNSPHIFYGLLGFKLYFYYVPLLYLGYAYIRSDEELRKFLVLNAVLAGAIGGLGIAQSILGHQFLNPEQLAPELEDLGALYKSTPLTHQEFYLPNSVFVSTGRFSIFLVVALILALATTGYLLLNARRGRTIVLISTAIIGVAVLVSGSRGAAVGAGLSAAVLCAGFLWGAPWRWRQAHRLVRAIRHSILIAALGLAALVLLFPQEAGSRLDFYTETLNPNSSAYELSYRTWDYPLLNLLKAFENPNWVLGNGIGTASLGSQYVAKFIGQRPPGLWVENGYGVLILEMGIIAPFLWVLWTGALVYYSWKVVRRLRQTRLFPIAFGIFWWAFFLLVPQTFGGLFSYQNYVCNAYLWLLVGVLFRLPDLLTAVPQTASISPARRGQKGGFEF